MTNNTDADISADFEKWYYVDEHDCSRDFLTEEEMNLEAYKAGIEQGKRIENEEVLKLGIECLDRGVGCETSSNMFNRGIDYFSKRIAARVSK